MNVKELILKQDIENIIKYMQEHFIAEYEDKEEIEKRFDEGFRLSIEDIKNTIPKTNTNHIIYGLPYKDYNSDGTVDEYVNHCVINLDELKIFNPNIQIHTFEDITVCHFPEHWGLMFLDWETILGYEFIDSGYVSELSLACDILWELTFFGYTKETNKINSDKEAEVLDERKKELDEAIETGDNSKFHTLDDDFFFNLEKKFGKYNGMTDEEIKGKRAEDKRLRDIAVKKTFDDALEWKKKEFELLKELKKKYC